MGLKGGTFLSGDKKGFSLLPVIVTAASSIRHMVVRGNGGLAESSVSTKNSASTKKDVPSGPPQAPEPQKDIESSKSSFKKRSDDLSSEQSKLRTIHQSIKDGIIVLGSNSFITYANPAAESILGKKEFELAGSHGTGIAELDELLTKPVLVDKKNMVQCWKYHGCEKDDCPAFENNDLRCWLHCMNGDVDSFHYDFTQKMEGCDRCPVYRNNNSAFIEMEIDGRDYKMTVASISNSTGENTGRLAVIQDITEERMRVQQFDLLYRISSSNATAANIEDFLSQSLDLCMEAMNSSCGSIFMNENGSGPVIAASQGGFREMISGNGHAVTDVVAKVSTDGEPILVTNESRGLLANVFETINDSVFIAINDENGIVGVLVLSGKMTRDGFTSEVVDFLWPIALQIGMAFSRCRLNDEVAHEKEKQEAIVASMGENLCVIDLKRVIQFANSAYKDIFGEECVGKHCYEVYMCQDKPCVACPLDRCFETGETVRHSFYTNDKDGSQRWLETTVSPLRDAEGNITSCIEISRDITELLNVKNQAETRLKALSTLFDISHTLSSSLELNHIVDNLSESTQSALDAATVAIMLFDKKNSKLVLKSISGNNEDWSLGVDDEVDLSSNYLKKLTASRKPLQRTTVNELTPLLETLAPPSSKSILIGRLSTRGKFLGIMVAASNEQNAFEEPGKTELFIDIANQASVAIDNAEMYKCLEDTFWDTIRSLAEAIDAKDSYTRGHSDRVALYAEALARELDLDEELMNAVRYAGYLHDTGKIGIPDAILLKAGRLTDQEFSLIMDHPILSHKIIEPVDFLQDVKPLVRHHHERIDGNGYPDGLKGNEIPLGAKIIGIADAYEAMTSDRPYRKALSQEAAIEELKRCSGTQFEPKLVETFIEVLDKEEIS